MLVSIFVLTFISEHLFFVELTERFLDGMHHLQINSVALVGAVKCQSRNPIALSEKDFFGYHL